MLAKDLLTFTEKKAWREFDDLLFPTLGDAETDLPVTKVKKMNVTVSLEHTKILHFTGCRRNL